MVANNMFLAGKHSMDNIRRIVASIKKEEKRQLSTSQEQTHASVAMALFVMMAGALVFLVIVLFLFNYIRKTFDRQQRAEETTREANISLERVLSDNQVQNWLLTGITELNERMQGEQSETELADHILHQICKYSHALVGTFYLFDEEKGVLDLYASYAFHDLNRIKRRIKIAENWLGQVAANQRTAFIHGMLNEALLVQSSLISIELVNSIIVPFFFEKKLKGFMEIAFDSIDENQKAFIQASAKDIGIAVNTLSHVASCMICLKKSSYRQKSWKLSRKKCGRPTKNY